MGTTNRCLNLKISATLLYTLVFTLQQEPMCNDITVILHTVEGHMHISKTHQF